ncbi:ABC transporter permease [Nocardioides marmotae]|nr:ABC transporter permease [Nocardioides marmotae]
MPEPTSRRHHGDAAPRKGTTAMFEIARSELIQMLRNRLVLATGLAIPIAFSAYAIHQHETFSEVGSPGYLAAIVMFVVMALGLYTTAVTTLASRRQDLFLKRLRSTAASDPDIIAGLLLPLTVIALVQVGTFLAVFGVVATSPAQIPLLVVAILTTTAMMVALALATAGLTNSPEHAQVTTLPVSLALVAVASWVGITGTESLGYLKRLLPGGSATELVVNAWGGGVPLADSLPLLLPTMGWVVAAVALAVRLFRWEPRR